MIRITAAILLIISSCYLNAEDGLIGQEIFVLPPNEVPPSELEYEKLYSTGADVNAKQQTFDKLDFEQIKKDTYNDLKHYFKQHEWILISISFYDYFSKNNYYDYDFVYPKDQVQKYTDDILRSLPKGSYLIDNSADDYPLLELAIKEAALESIYKNKKITSFQFSRNLRLLYAVLDVRTFPRMAL